LRVIKGPPSTAKAIGIDDKYGKMVEEYLKTVMYFIQAL
jgi:hypothetical protein